MNLTYQPDLFSSSLPQHILCSDDPEEYGSSYKPREKALKRAYIAPNCKALVWALVFDIDRPDAAVAWSDAQMPRPNWICQNLDAEGDRAGRAHLGYALAVPVSRTLASRATPQRFLARVQHGMTIALGADRSYTHRLTKTPSHPQWRTLWERGQPYDLGELRDYLGTDLPLRIPREQAVGEGRNVSLFDGLRAWAYKERLNYNSLHQWDLACRAEAEARNLYAAPLALREVHQIAKSVAGWTWKNITHSGLAVIQQQRQKLQVAKRQSAIIDRHAFILNL